MFQSMEKFGKPLDEAEYMEMQNSKKEFKRKVKQKRRLEREIFCEKLAEASSVNDTRDFWQLVKNGISPTPSIMKARCVTSKAESVDTLHLWKEHFGAIISSGDDKDLERDRKAFQELLETVEGKSKWP